MWNMLREYIHGLFIFIRQLLFISIYGYLDDFSRMY